MFQKSQLFSSNNLNKTLEASCESALVLVPRVLLRQEVTVVKYNGSGGLKEVTVVQYNGSGGLKNTDYGASLSE